ncbi:MAG TPA: DHH family phosphoesterase [Patescibacteria group bacterium]|nr:DHH family phosphoesterase [Patescibacteria group bacterium]
MDYTHDITTIKDLLDKASDVLLVTHEHPTFDSMGSTLALYLGLTGLGKKVTVACPDPMTVELSGFVGANKIVNTLGRKNFIISLDYVDGSIEKVSYNIEGNKFNLVIEPRPGFDNFSQDKVHYSYAGSSASLIITVDTIHLGGLKKLYDEDKDLYAKKPIVNIDRHPNNAHYGSTNMVNPDASSTAEVVMPLLNGLGIALTEDIATNLFNALLGATNSFQNPNVTSEAYEAAAALVRAGAKRFAKPVVGQEEAPSGSGESVASEPAKVETTIPATPAVTPAPVNPQPTSTTTQPSALPPSPSPKKQVAPPDWLKPKIFKSTNIA